MRKSKMIVLLPFLSAIMLTACNGSKDSNKEKISEIPVSTSSKEAQASFQKGLGFSDDGDAQQARTYFSKAIEQDSSLGIAYLFRAGTATTPSEFSDDVTKAKDHLNGASDWEKWYYDFSATFLNSDYNKRLDIVKKIADKYPDAARAQIDLGNTYSQANDFAKARECFLKAVDLNPNWAGAQTAVSTSYLFNEPKDFKKGETYAQKAVQLSPNSPGAQILLGDCYRAEDDMTKARDAYAKAITLAPNTSAGYYKKGHAESFLGNLDEARKNYMEGSKYDSVKMNAMLNYANTYVYGGDSKAACKWIMEQYNKIDSGTETSEKKLLSKLNALNYCAQIAFHLEDVASLKDMVGKIEPLSNQLESQQPTNEAKLTQHASIIYWQAAALAVDGKYDDAKKKAEEMKTSLQPVNDPLKNEGYEFLMGYISMKQKNYADAVSHFEKSDPNVIYNLYWLAMANEAAGNKDKAKDAYKKIAVYNFNDVGYALIRNDAKKKAAM